ncbi:hypothetical protein CLF_109517 [Clonorchis sinensis]|uniref:Peptidase A2 domain-containing protein n=1 Tax=Clonorchis sinensis TaxID=79923 RepID=G7YSP2_CLOSI|nr:hypothetical protein CLF_109517 [Clonorchis sinensis]
MSIEFNQLRELLQQQQKQFEEAQLKLIESLSQRLHIQTAATSTAHKSRSNWVTATFEVDFACRMKFVTDRDNKSPVRLQLDTGSDIMLLSERMWKRIVKPHAHWFQLLQFRSPENGNVESTTKPWMRRHVQFVRKLGRYALKAIALMHERHWLRDWAISASVTNRW